MDRFLKTLGPGILFASTAIGVSHLVQSTRAGATYGFALIGFIIAANLFKYPFFEYGSRYANATGESIIDGYKRLSKWMLYLYFLITISSMFFVTAAVGFVTAGFLENLFGWGNPLNFKLFTTTVLFVFCVVLLSVGKYNALDKLIKLVGMVLLVSTLIAFILTLINGPQPKIDSFVPKEIFNESGFLFIIALMGWMPTAVDLSTWNSLWTLERIEQTGYKPSLKETVREFNLGYWGSAGLSICFLTLGAFIIYGTGQDMPDGSAGFANRVVELYTSTIGNWSYFIIAAAAFSIMFSTSIGVFDGYARALERTIEIGFLNEDKHEELIKSKRIYIITLVIVAVGAYLIIALFLGKLKALVDLATTISFLISPIIAFVNFRLVQARYVGAENTPNRFMVVLSWAGLIFLSGFSLFFLAVKLQLIQF